MTSDTVIPRPVPDSFSWGIYQNQSARFAAVIGGSWKVGLMDSNYSGGFVRPGWPGYLERHLVCPQATSPPCMSFHESTGSLGILIFEKIRIEKEEL